MVELRRGRALNAKKSHVALALATVLFIASIAALVTALTPSFQTYGQPGSMAEPYTYLVFTDGVSFFAKNGTSGAIEYASTNASSVIQSAFNAAASMQKPDVATNGAPLVEFSAGNFTMSWTVTITYALNVIGAGRGQTQFIPTLSGLTMFRVRPTTAIFLFQWERFKIDHWNKAITATGINFDTSGGGTTNEFKMYDVEIRDVSVGITGSLNSNYNWFTMCAFVSAVTLTASNTGQIKFDFNVISTTLTFTGGYIELNSNTVLGSVVITGSSVANVAAISGNTFEVAGGSAQKFLNFPNRASPATIKNVVISGNVFHDTGTTGTSIWVYVGNNVQNVEIADNQFSSAGSTDSISWGTGTTGLTIKNNLGWNPQPSSSLTAGTSPYTFPLLPYDAIYVITTVGGMTALTLDSQALFGGTFAVGQQIYVGANHALIATWATTASIFQVLPE